MQFGSFKKNSNQLFWLGLFLAAGLAISCPAGIYGAELRSHGWQEVEKAQPKVQVQEILRVPIGSGEAELGVVTPEEANPEGPMSFTVGQTGELYVLDQTNSRIQVYEKSQWKRTIPIPARTYSDLEILPGDKIALLDSLVKKEVTVIDLAGKVQASFTLVKPEIPQPEEIIGVYYIATGNWPGLWVRADNQSFLMAEKDLRPVPNAIKIPGLLTTDGRRLLKVEIVDEKEIMISRSDEVFSKWKNFSVSFPLPLGVIYGVWQDDRNNIYLAANVYNFRQERNQVVVLKSEGKEIGRVDLYVSKVPNEVFYPVRVTASGEIFQLAIEEKEVVVRKYNY
ncbi:MAG: hypothetical protein H5U07_09735 [Candidatus Aminicenantes bacterium]|nr:hypothetical protein [Candidatus Aminicenantes bacterium]